MKSRSEKRKDFIKDSSQYKKPRYDNTSFSNEISISHTTTSSSLITAYFLN